MLSQKSANFGVKESNEIRRKPESKSDPTTPRKKNNWQLWSEASVSIVQTSSASTEQRQEQEIMYSIGMDCSIPME
jgi:hypothetical protein